MLRGNWPLSRMTEWFLYNPPIAKAGRLARTPSWNKLRSPLRPPCNGYGQHCAGSHPLGCVRSERLRRITLLSRLATDHRMLAARSRVQP